MRVFAPHKKKKKKTSEKQKSEKEKKRKKNPKYWKPKSLISPQGKHTVMIQQKEGIRFSRVWMGCHGLSLIERLGLNDKEKLTFTNTNNKAIEMNTGSFCIFRVLYMQMMAQDM